ncbi:Ulp1 protease family, C-terminal catalytic domain [Sesbania bispinosa]|nr:Ulp1 protease family, C-terminal catalytic domain [Sesbania bispinosa]
MAGRGRCRVTRPQSKANPKKQYPVAKATSNKQSAAVKATQKNESPATDGNNKKQRISKPIKISSTNTRESNPSSNPKDVQGSQTLNQNNGLVQNHGGVDEAWMRNSVEQIRDVVTNFTNFMMSKTMQTQPGMTPPSDRLTKSAPSLKTDSKADGQTNVEGSSFHRVEIHPFSKRQERGYYINYEPIHCSKYEGRKTGIVTPEWVCVLFKPPPYLVLDEIEACMAAYIFGCNKHTKVMRKEVLIKSSWGYGERRHLKSLMPRSLLEQEVLNHLAAQLTNIERLTSKYTTCWFLPTTVSIFVPMNDSNIHWYLLVVDMKEKELILLDSNPCASRSDWRKISVKKVVTDGKRMMLSLNLVLKPYNKMKDEVVKLAFKNLKNLEERRKALVKIDGDGE